MRLTIAALAVALSACGASIPKRFVVERDIDDAYRYRRYQKVLDVEVPVPGNEAVGHTAVYERDADAEGPDLAVAFVARHARARGLAMEVHRAVGRFEGYEARVSEVHGGNAWVLSGEEGDLWALWVSGRHVVKVGSPEAQSLPGPVAELYMEIYPSELDEDGRPEPGAQSAGDASPEPERRDEAPVPRFFQ